MVKITVFIFVVRSVFAEFPGQICFAFSSANSRTTYTSYCLDSIQLLLGLFELSTKVGVLQFKTFTTPLQHLELNNFFLVSFLSLSGFHRSASQIRQLKTQICKKLQSGHTKNTTTPLDNQLHQLHF